MCASGGERGIVLVSALLVMLLLLPLGVGFLSVSLTESTIASNQATSSQALNLAEAGIALAKRTLRDSPNWDLQLAAAQPFICPAFGPAGTGNCSYLIENDPADPGGPTTDTNNLVVIKSTGQLQTSAKEVHVALTRSLISQIPAAITSTGIGANLSYSGGSNAIDGNNWIPPSDDGTTPAVMDNSACGPGTGPKFGISVPDSTQQNDLKGSIDPSYWATITGEAPDPPWSPPAVTPSIGVAGTYMTQAQLENMADQLMAQADVTYTPGTSVLDEVISTQAVPKVVAVDCTGYDPASTCLQLDGTTKGAGILVVKNGQLHLRATVQWVGIIIVVGENVSFDTGGGGGPGNIIYGSVLIGENTAVQPRWYRPRNTKLCYSCDAINLANSMGQGQGEVAWWKEVSG